MVAAGPICLHQEWRALRFVITLDPSQPFQRRHTMCMQLRSSPRHHQNGLHRMLCGTEEVQFNRVRRPSVWKLRGFVGSLFTDHGQRSAAAAKLEEGGTDKDDTRCGGGNERADFPCALAFNFVTSNPTFDRCWSPYFNLPNYPPCGFSLPHNIHNTPTL